jgi:hypothetical protein
MQRACRWPIAPAARTLPGHHRGGLARPAYRACQILSHSVSRLSQLAEDCPDHRMARGLLPKRQRPVRVPRPSPRLVWQQTSTAPVRPPSTHPVTEPHPYKIPISQKRCSFWQASLQVWAPASERPPNPSHPPAWPRWSSPLPGRSHSHGHGCSGFQDGAPRRGKHICVDSTCPLAR